MMYISDKKEKKKEKKRKKPYLFTDATSIIHQL